MFLNLDLYKKLQKHKEKKGQKQNENNMTILQLFLKVKIKTENKTNKSEIAKVIGTFFLHPNLLALSIATPITITQGLIKCVFG